MGQNFRVLLRFGEKLCTSAVPAFSEWLEIFRSREWRGGGFRQRRQAQMRIGFRSQCSSGIFSRRSVHYCELPDWTCLKISDAWYQRGFCGDTRSSFVLVSQGATASAGGLMSPPTIMHEKPPQEIQRHEPDIICLEEVYMKTTNSGLIY